MPLGFRSIIGLTFNQMNDGLLKIAQIPGDPGFGPSAAVITVIGSGLPPSTPGISMQLFPSGHTSNGTDSLGNISATATFVNSGNDKLFNISGGGTATFVDGFWEQAVRGLCNDNTGSYGFDIQFSVLDVDTDFPGNLNDNPSDLEGIDPVWDEDTDEGSVDLQWQYDNLGENPDAFVILRDGVAIGSVPSHVSNSYSFTDYVFAVGDYEYTIKAYKYGAPNSISGASNSISVSFSTADITIIGSGGIDLGGAAVMVFITDPSGIYTLVVDKTHDTLIQRTTEGFVDVKIPNPFIKTGFI